MIHGYDDETREKVEVLAKSEAATKTDLTGKSNTNHTHDDRYFTEAEVTAKLNTKSNTGHTHDDRYYTEAEMNAKLNAKANSSHTHNTTDINNLGAKYEVNAGSVTMNYETTSNRGNFTLPAGTYIISAMTSWASGHNASNGHAVGHQIATSGNSKSGINNLAQAAIPYNALNNVRAHCTTIVTLTASTTLYLVAYNRGGDGNVCDAAQMVAVRIR